jgi:hypothetical protein
VALRALKPTSAMAGANILFMIPPTRLSIADNIFPGED